MIEYIKSFPLQFQGANDIIAQSSIKNEDSKIYTNVVICGLGGSGIAGDFIQNILNEVIDLPIIVVKDYVLPKYVNKDSLLILNSYSGNTEELLDCYCSAIKRGLKPICISSGGKLKELALENNFEYIELPQNMPPRSTFGFGTFCFLSILFAKNLISFPVEKLFEVGDFLEQNFDEINTAAIDVAKELKNKIIIAFSDNNISSIPLRFKQQINENSKALCWYNVYSEMNHNELVGWKNKQTNFAIVHFYTDFDNERNRHRIAFSKNVISETQAHIIDIHAKGDDFITQCYYLIMFGDLISYHLGVLYNEDTIEVNILTMLKKHMENL